jgi:C-terminal processing protease CtpA/Prc
MNLSLRPLLAASALALSLLAGCMGSGSSSAGSQPVSNPVPVAPATLSEKQALVAIVKFLYLWPETLPAKPDLAAASTLPDLLDQLTATARGQGLDRGWSYVSQQLAGVSGAAPALYYGLGASVLVRADRVWVRDVMPGSDAARQGVSRGDELLAAAATRAGLDQPESQVSSLFGASPAAQMAAKALLGPDGPATVQFRLRKPEAAGTVDLAVARSQFPANLVPEADRAVVVHQDAQHRVGYLQLRAFEAEADGELRQAFAHLGQAGVTDLVVDLRYNGGGLVSTARLLVNLLRGGAAAFDVMYRPTHNANRQPYTIWFSPEPGALRLGRIAFIVTGDTASASELVANVLAPYLRADLALVGSRTYGKPVAMEGFAIPGTSWMVHPVSMRPLNADGFSHFSQGLPDAHYQGTTWAAEDDLTHAPGDPAEASTAAAVRWILGDTAGLDPIPPAPTVQATALSDTAAAGQAKPEPYRGEDPNRPGLF